MSQSDQNERKAAGGSNYSSRFDKFSHLNIAVLTKRDDHGEQLIRELQKTSATVQHIWPIPDEIPTEFDVVYCDLVDDLASRIKGLPGVPQVAIIAVILASGNIDIKALENSVPHGVVHLPCTSQSVLSSLISGRSQYQYERRLHQRIEKLDENLRSMKTIERAKVIMMQCKKISEEEAYRHMRRRAMERRVSIGTLASAIVDSQDLLG